MARNGRHREDECQGCGRWIGVAAAMRGERHCRECSAPRLRKKWTRGDPERAYRMRVEYGMLWADIAEELGYRPGARREALGQTACGMAHQYARQASMPPPPHAGRLTRRE